MRYEFGFVGQKPNRRAAALRVATLNTTSPRLMENFMVSMTAEAEVLPHENKNQRTASTGSPRAFVSELKWFVDFSKTLLDQKNHPIVSRNTLCANEGLYTALQDPVQQSFLTFYGFSQYSPQTAAEHAHSTEPHNVRINMIPPEPPEPGFSLPASFCWLMPLFTGYKMSIIGKNLRFRPG
ncbi:hypothetical protein GOODEAATRI_032142 [Goodea atripinnis]|uniref:Uncharacterized protein n=1 Tax=Goodea atripinnis TaxID=208336 RepID=A0ABV0NFE1_9TELE